MYCTACGAEIADGSRFCKNCGGPQHAPPSQDSSYVTSGNGRLALPPKLRKKSDGNHFWLWVIIVPLVVLAVLITMIGAMRPSSQTKSVEFTSPREVSFSGTGPDTAKVGVPIEFVYEVTNTGTADFKDFRIAFPDKIEKYFDISASRPSGTVKSETGKRMLLFGSLSVGQKTTVAVTLVPKVEGDGEVTATFYDGTAVLTDARSKGMVYKKVKISS